MKKLLGLLGSLGLMTSTGFAVVSCHHSDEQTTIPDKKIEIKDVTTEINTYIQAIKNKIASSQASSELELKNLVKGIDKKDAEVAIHDVAVKADKFIDARITITLNEGYKVSKPDALSFTVNKAILLDVTDEINNYINAIEEALNTFVAESDLQNTVDSVSQSDTNGAIASVIAMADTTDPSTADITITLNDGFIVTDQSILSFTVNKAILLDVTDEINNYINAINEALNTPVAESDLQNTVNSVSQSDTNGAIASVLATADKTDPSTADITITLNEGYKVSKPDALSFTVNKAILLDVTDEINNYINAIKEALNTPVAESDLQNTVDSVSQSDTKGAIANVVAIKDTENPTTADITITLNGGYIVSDPKMLSFKVEKGIKKLIKTKAIEDYLNKSLAKGWRDLSSFEGTINSLISDSKDREVNIPGIKLTCEFLAPNNFDQIKINFVTDDKTIMFDRDFIVFDNSKTE